MTYTEIIEKLKTIFEDVEEFAFFQKDQYPLHKCPEALEAQRHRQDFMKLHCPDWIWDSEKNKQDFKNLPNEYDIFDSLYRKQIDLSWEDVDDNDDDAFREDWYSVKYFPEHDIYIKVTGYFKSWSDEVEFEEGWDCCEDVKPVQKTITIYERITD